MLLGLSICMMPTLKEKKRYIAFEVLSKAKITKKAAQNAINKSILELIGNLGYAKAANQFIDVWKNNKGIIKVSHTEVEKLKASLLFVESIDNNEAIVRSIGSSGILKKADERYLN